MSFIKEVISPHYGRVNYRLIGIVDLKEMALKKDFNFPKWDNNYHPRSYFTAFSLEIIEKEEKKSFIDGFESYAVFVPLEEDNKQWKPEPYNKFYETWLTLKPRQRILPISISKKEVQKWQESAKDILLPDYFYEVKSITDIQDSFYKQHPSEDKCRFKATFK